MTSANFTSEGFDLDALAGDGEVVYEIGGGASTSPTTPATENEPRKEEEDDPVAKSEALKAEGNESFKAGNYLDAYDLYTDAIEACPGMTGDEILKLRDEFNEREREAAMRRHREETERRRTREDAEAKARREKGGSNSGGGDSGGGGGSDDDDDDGDEKKDERENRPNAFRAPHHPHGKKLAIYHCNRAACSLHLGRNEEALSDCDVAVLLNPGYVKAHLRRMTANENMDRTEEALADAKKALFHDPTNANARRNVDRLQKIEDERLEKLKEETMGKLKDLGNSILGNFGLSLDNFKAEKDPKTGGYSISFEQNK